MSFSLLPAQEESAFKKIKILHDSVGHGGGGGGGGGGGLIHHSAAAAAAAAAAAESNSPHHPNHPSHGGLSSGVTCPTPARRRHRTTFTQVGIPKKESKIL